MNIDIKTLNKILANPIQQYVKWIIQHDQVELISGIQRWFNICKSLNAINDINKMKNTNYIFISIGTEIALEKLQH